MLRIDASVCLCFFFFLMIRRPPRSTQSRSSAASDVYKRQVEIKAPAWTRAQFSLPDGTTGWLNSNSSLRYYEDFISNRKVVLTGEAYFDVIKDNNRPFHVFQVMGMQLRAASCLPALAEEIKRGRFGNTEDLLGEALGEEVMEDILEEGRRMAEKVSSRLEEK